MNGVVFQYGFFVMDKHFAIFGEQFQSYSGKV